MQQSSFRNKKVTWYQGAVRIDPKPEEWFPTVIAAYSSGMHRSWRLLRRHVVWYE